MQSMTAAIGALALAAGVAGAQNVTVTIENLNQSEGFFFTPFWIAAHNGGFDSYDGGTLASTTPWITPLAEDGITTDITNAFAASAAGVAGGVDTTVLAVSGPGDPPVLSPGESVTVDLGVGDPTVNRYFSYASMVIPSNDLFVANGNPFAHELFDAAGNFSGPLEILIFGSDVNDNGTEANDASAGAAFSANGGSGIDENVNIRNFFTLGGDADYLASFLGSGTASGDTINAVFGPTDLIGRITIVPAPASAALLVLSGLAARRRR